MKDRLFVISALDNVATALCEVSPGEALLGGDASGRIYVTQTIPQGHKVALMPLEKGNLAVKGQVAIGVVTRHIEQGEWVHTHNLKSRCDAREGPGPSSEKTYKLPSYE